MDWSEVIESLENTMRGAERAAKSFPDPMHKLEAKVVSGVAAALAVALRSGLEAADRKGGDA